MNKEQHQALLKHRAFGSLLNTERVANARGRESEKGGKCKTEKSPSVKKGGDSLKTK
jgi:hypothetical protein